MSLLLSWQYFLLAICALCVLLTTALFVTTVYHLWWAHRKPPRHETQTELRPSIKYTNIACMVAAIGCTISVFILFLHAFLHRLPLADDSLSNRHIFTAIDFFSFSCKSLLYSILLLRLHITFNDSYLRVPRLCFIVLWLQCVIGIICFINILIAVMDARQYARTLHRVMPFVVALCINETIMLLSFLYLFNSRLWRFISNMSEDQPSAHHMNKKQQSLLDVIVRINILSLIAVSLTTLMYSLVFADTFLRATSREEVSMIFRVSQALVTTMDSCTIFLSLRFAQNVYNKLCKCCHVQCYSMCVQCHKCTTRRTQVAAMDSYAQMEDL